MRPTARRLGLLTTMLAGLGVLAPTSLAYLKAGGSGTVRVVVGSITAPSAVAVTQSGSTLSLGWSPATLSGGGAVTGYQVTRSDGVVICGASTPVTATSCTDTAPAAGAVTYTVRAVYATFSATASSAALTALSAPSVTGTPSLYSAATAPSFTFSGGGSSTAQCRLDTGSWTTCTSPITYSALSAGAHVFAVRATSGTSTGPVSSYAWTIDPASPTITAAPSNPSAVSSPAFTFASSESTYTYRCAVDGGAYRACTSPANLTGLTDGTHTFAVQAVSPDGAVTASSSDTWLIDTTPPTSTLAFPTAALTVNATSFNAGCSPAPYNAPASICGTAADTGSGVARVLVSIQQGLGNYWTGTGFTSPTEVRLTATGTTRWTLPLSATNLPADGTYTVRVYAVDNAGNVQTATMGAGFILDTTPPALAISRINGGGLLNLTSLPNVSSFGGSCGSATGDLGTLSWTITASSGVISRGTTTCATGAWTVTLGAVLATVGSYTLGISQSDQAGNTASATLAVGVI